MRHVGQVYPKAKKQRVVLTIDHAPGPRGPLSDAALREKPHLEFYRRPRYSPQLNGSERCWKKRRRRATHHRLFEALADRKRSVRNSRRYFQGAPRKWLTLSNGRPKSKKAAK